MKKLGLMMNELIERLLGMRLLYRMMIFYIIGGILPMILSGYYLVNGLGNILVEKERDSKVFELETVKSQILESLDTVNTVSKYFYFDEELENIAFRNYVQYQDNIQDFKSYTAFNDYASYNNNIIRNISIYLTNETITGNSQFMKVNDEIRNSKWYMDTLLQNGMVNWIDTNDGSFISLSRLIKTKKQKEVGVLMINIRDQRITEILRNIDGSLVILLNKDQQLASTGAVYDNLIYGDHLKNANSDIIFQNITYKEERYAFTCVNVPLPESEDQLQIVNLQLYEDILEESNQKSKESIMFLLLSVVVSALLIVLFSKSLSKRVKYICKQMQKAASGDFNLEKKLKGNDEISELYEYLTTIIWSIQSLLAEIYQEQLQKERLKTKQKDIEFKMLASQINPHFLYNTLETIRMKARESGEYELEELVKMLAIILRHNIQVGKRLVTIQSEVELLENYLKIQQYRFGDRISYQITMEEGLENHEILPLIMQPIVENSIIHGLEIKEGQGNIHINIHKVLESISIVIEDDGLGIDHQTLEKIQQDLNKDGDLDRTHIGIANVHQRIKIFYGDRYGMKIYSSVNVGTRIEMIIPINLDGEVNQ